MQYGTSHVEWAKSVFIIIVIVNNIISALLWSNIHFYIVVIEGMYVLIGIAFILTGLYEIDFFLIYLLKIWTKDCRIHHVIFNSGIKDNN